MDFHDDISMIAKGGCRRWLCNGIVILILDNEMCGHHELMSRTSDVNELPGTISRDKTRLWQ